MLKSLGNERNRQLLRSLFSDPLLLKDKQPCPVLPFLVLFDFLVFFPSEELNSFVFLNPSSLLFQGFSGSARIKNPCLFAVFFLGFSGCRKGGVWFGGACRHTKTAKTVKTAETAKTVKRSTGAACCHSCFSRANVCYHCGWQEPTRTAKTVETAKTVKCYTPPLFSI